MEIGILTYHRSHNYGALLQAIALRKVLSELGHSVTFIDYWPAYHKRMYARFNWVKALNVLHPFKCLYYVAKRLYTLKTVNKRIQNVESFIKQFVTPYCSSLSEQYDVVVCGSDQIWRKQPEQVGFNSMYFGKNNISASKQISYAASIGCLPTTETDKQKVKDLIKNLNRISVRENDLKNMLFEFGFDDVDVSLDPTLLLSSEKWCHLIPKRRYIDGKYALFYEVAPNCFNEKKLKNYCDSRGLNLVVLRTNSLRTETSSELCTVSPDIFVNLVRYSDFVFTSSFHGLAFSIINHKNFLSSVSHGNSRLVSLMDQLGIKNHFIKPGSDIPMNIMDIDYAEVEKKLSDLREKSLAYLADSI